MKGHRTAAIPPDANVASLQGAEFSTASHEELFREAGDESCDICSSLIAPEGDSAGQSRRLPLGRVAGQGSYVWIRGDEVRVQRVPLCSSCASAIGVAALARWEIEEEEG
jgi:hypothetical protein